MEMEQMTQTGLVVASTKKGEMDLDLALKRVLACKPILARILKGVVEECSGMDAEEVEACIEGEVSVDRVLLGPGLTNSIIGEAQEDYQNGEGMVRYDIRTFLKVPSVSWADRIKILIDLEAQKDDKPGYDIPLRALFYCCRMVSAQLGQEFTLHKDDPVKYGNLKKVYSIFICSGTAQIRANSIEKYRIAREMLYGANPDNPRYDLMNAVVINISRTRNTGENANALIALLTDLLNESMDTERKLRVLQEQHGIPMTEEIEEEVREMCTYTASVLEQGKELGIAMGEASGEARLARLIKVLIDENKYEEINRATVSEKDRKELYRQYGIVDE